jgi:hypothetical protein
LVGFGRGKGREGEKETYLGIIPSLSEFKKNKIKIKVSVWFG